MEDTGWKCTLKYRSRRPVRMGQTYTDEQLMEKVKPPCELDELKQHPVGYELHFVTEPERLKFVKVKTHEAY